MKMKKIFTFLVVSFFISELLFSQDVTYEWTKTIGGKSYDKSYSITTDNSGNIYITGCFSDTVDFDPGIEENIHVSEGNTDVFIEKFNSNGDFLWVKTFGAADYDEGNSIAVDKYGNVYVIGTYRGTVDFDPGVGVDNHTSVGIYDIFVEKLDSVGNFVWAKTFGGSDWDGGSSIAVDSAGNVYVTGYFRDTVDFDPGSGEEIRFSEGYNDVFVEKLDSVGNFLWVRTFGGKNFDKANSLTIDINCNVYVTGYFKDTVDFDPSLGEDIHISAGYSDFYIEKLDASGDFQWVKTFGNVSTDEGYSITSDNSGNIFVTGCFSDTVDFDSGIGVDNHISAGYEDVFVLKLDTGGNYIWAKTFGGIDEDYGISIATDYYGDVYVSGFFWESPNFDPGTGVESYTSNGDGDVFVEKLDANGNFLWVRTFGGLDDDYSSSVSINNTGILYVTGYYRDTVNFNSGSSIDSQVSMGYEDIFVQKLSQTFVDVSIQSNNIQMFVYPNPVRDRVSIVSKKPINDVEIVITDVQGNYLFIKNYRFLYHTKVDLKEFPSGVYFVTIKSKKSLDVIKLIKE